MFNDLTGGTQVLGDFLLSFRNWLLVLFHRGRYRVINNTKENRDIQRHDLAVCLLKGMAPDKRLDISGVCYNENRNIPHWDRD